MSSSFASLKKNRGSLKDKILEETDKLASGGHSEDSRLWKPTADSAGNGTAVIRFLAPPEGEDVPFVRLFEHGFKGPGGWLFANCPTSIENDCPVCNYNTSMWDTEDKTKQQWVRDNSKRKLSYYANILVVKDPAHPENDGKVFLFKFGQKIFEKIKFAMKPEFDDQDPMNPFDMWEGANFRLRMRNEKKGKSEFRSYDDSVFDSVSAISDDDDEIKAVWDQAYSLQEFVDPSQFQSFDELQAQVVRVFKLDTDVSTGLKIDEDEHQEEEPVAAKEAAPKQSPAVSDDDDDDDLKSFAALMED